MKMKKVLLAVLLVTALTVLAAGMASAGGWKRHGGRGGQMWNPRMGGGRGGACFMQGGYGPHGGMAYGYRKNADRTNVPEIPQEIRDKFTEAQKTAIDLRAELERNPVDRDKAMEFYAKHRTLMQEICDWHFQQRLDALTAR